MPGQATEVAPAAQLTDAGAGQRTIEMRAAVLREPGKPVAIETVLLDPPKRGEVLVRVAAAGVCHSDVHLADGLLGPGRWPMVLGHEGAGVVTSVGEGVTRSRPATTSRSASCRLAGRARRAGRATPRCARRPGATAWPGC